MAAASTEDERMARLPKWARDRIGVLERNLAYERARLAVGAEGADTFAEPHAEQPRPLGEGTMVEFVTGRYADGGSRDYFQARLHSDGSLSVRGSDQIAIFPSVSNSVVVKLARQ